MEGDHDYKDVVERIPDYIQPLWAGTKYLTFTDPQRHNLDVPYNPRAC